MMYTWDMTAEEWRPVVSHKGYYEVSDQGRVRSLDRHSNSLGRQYRMKGRVLIPTRSSGRLMVTLSVNGVKTHRHISPLVLEAFIGPCPSGSECCHWDGDPTNDRLTNLRWDTHENNMADKLRHGRNNNAVKRHCPRGHNLFPPNLNKTRGPRGCAACSGANKWRINHALSLDDPRWLMEADRRYELIMSGQAPIAYKERTRCPRGHALESPNLVKKAPVRACLACSRTHKWGDYHGIHHTDPRWVTEADQRYDDIMNGRTRKVDNSKDKCKRGHPLLFPNGFQQARGKGCRACARARSWAYYYGMPATDARWIAEANRHYAEIMGPTPGSGCDNVG